MSKHVSCPGCGGVFSSNNLSVESNFNTIFSCLEAYYNLSAYTLSLRDDYFIHQLVVDSYTAQHVSSYMKPITISFALIGLYLVSEKNYSGKQVQFAHMRLASRFRLWPTIIPPQSKEWIHIDSIPLLNRLDIRDLTQKWSNSVWTIWFREKREDKAFQEILFRVKDIY